MSTTTAQEIAPTYSVCYDGGMRGTGIYSGTGLTLEQTQGDAEILRRMQGDAVVVCDQRESSAAQVERDAILQELRQIRVGLRLPNTDQYNFEARGVETAIEVIEKRSFESRQEGGA